MIAGLLAACSAPSPQAIQAETSAVQRAAAAPADVRYEAGVELPSGPGRELLIRQCLNCHELASLELFSDFYDLDAWRALVLSMRANGAELDDTQVERVSAYLAQHFGTGTP